MAEEADAAAGSTQPTSTSTTAPADTSTSSKNTTTKRQQLKHADQGKNVWPQFPKLQGAERRDRAHLQASGLMERGGNNNSNKNNNKNRKKSDTKQSADKKKDNDDDDTTTMMLFQHLGRALGGPDAVLRHQAVLKLERYLKARCEATGLSELDLLKISKCLWYTLYLADRQVVQAELSKIIARLVIETLAGSAEEDEYAAALYLRACEAAEQAEEEEVDDLIIKLADDVDNAVDEESCPIEEPDSEDENVDFLAKQMELLEEEDYDDAEDEDQNGETSSAQPVVDEMEVEDDGTAAEDDDDDDDDGGDDFDEDPVNAPHGRGAHLAALFFRTFLRTILHNWATMDKYRIDKFYTMLRYLMERMYGYCASRGWNAGMIRLFNDGLCDEVLCKVPNGVRCHLIDVCLDELVKHESDVTEAVFLDVIQPFFSMAQTGVDGDDLVHTRAVDNVLERFLDKYSIFVTATTASDPDGSTTQPRFQQVHVGTVAQFIFEMASDDETTRPRYRARLYEVYKKYTKCIRLNGEENDVDIARTGLCLLGDDDNEDDAREEDDAQGEDSDPESNPVVQVIDNLEPQLKGAEKSTQTLLEKTTEARATDKASKQQNIVENSKPQSTTLIDQSVELLKNVSTDARTTKKASKKEKKRNKKKRLVDGETQLVGYKGRPQQETVISDDWKLMMESQVKGKVSKLDTENEIMITMEEQRNAKAIMMKKNGQQQQSDGVGGAKKRHREQSEKLSESDKKRVKFGAKIRAKSHNDSMKDLRQASPPAGARPDKGILKNKSRPVSTKAKTMKKKGRSRA